jgi:hypothetical protein
MIKSLAELLVEINKKDSERPAYRPYLPLALDHFVIEY